MSSVPPPGLDPELLRGHLDRERPGLVSGPLEARLIEGGRSNSRTSSATDRTVGGAQAPARPRAGHRARHDARTPRDQRSPPDRRPGAGAAAALRGRLRDRRAVLRDGVRRGHPVPHRRAARSRWAPSAPGRRSSGCVDTLVDLHAVDPEAVGLGTSGGPRASWTGSCGAGANSWTPPATATWRASTSCTPRSAARCPPPRAHRRPRRLPPGQRPDRLRRPDQCRPRLGDVHPRRSADGPRAARDVQLPDLGLPQSPVSTTSGAAGHPAPAELIERYAARSGRDTSAISWYTAFAWFKLAVILEGIHYRYTLGQTVGAGFDRIGELVPVFIAHGLTTLQEG